MAVCVEARGIGYAYHLSFDGGTRLFRMPSILHHIFEAASRHDCGVYVEEL